MHALTLQAFLDELEKIAGEGLDRIMKAGLGKLTRSAEGAVEAGVGHAKMPFIPVRGAGKVLGQDVKQMMQTPQVKGALKLRNPETMSLAQKAQAAYKDIDATTAGGRAGIFHGETVSPARSVVTDVGRGVRTPQELADRAASMRNKLNNMGAIPSPAPVRRTLTGQLVPTAPTAPALPTTGRFVPNQSGVFRRGTATGLQAPVAAAG